MKPLIIVAAALVVMVGFVAIIGASKASERQAALDRINANFAASRMQIICDHYRMTRPDDPNVASACGLVNAVSEQPSR